jgi:saccharopine dehydrogenase (NAD+, L-lysine-forming)
VTVEASACRCVPVEEYRAVGCAVEPEEHSWRTKAPAGAIILGLKEIEGDFPLTHRHICFFHCFKQQDGWRETLQVRAARAVGGTRGLRERLAPTPAPQHPAIAHRCIALRLLVLRSRQARLLPLAQRFPRSTGLPAPLLRAPHSLQPAVSRVRSCFARGKVIRSAPTHPPASFPLSQRFARGKGLLWDLEFLERANGGGGFRRVAAFGVPAGQMGMAVAVRAWCHQQLGGRMPPAAPWPSLDACVAELRQLLSRVPGGAKPSALVIGALGRCGSGACAVAAACGLTEVARWDMEETQGGGGGPFPALLQHDIVVNCVLRAPGAGAQPPFLTQALLDEADRTGGRRLSVLSDVSCDYTGPRHPFPFYRRGTSFEQPTLRVVEAADGLGEGGARRRPALDVIAIDNLPTLIASEASADYSAQLAEELLHLPTASSHPVWTRAQAVFDRNMQEALQQPEARL